LGGEVSLVAGSTMQTWGQVLDSGDVIIDSVGSQYYGKYAAIAGSGDVSLTTGGKLDYWGDILDSGDVEIGGATTVYLGKYGAVAGSGDVSITTGGHLTVWGDVIENDDVSVSAPTYGLYKYHSFTDNSSCSISGDPVSNSEPPIGCDATP